MQVKKDIAVNDYYKDRFFEGTDFQDYAIEKLYDNGIVVIPFSSRKYQLLKGESKSGFEFKYDKLFSKTGNFYIETAERQNKNNEFKPSGIDREDNTLFWCIGDYNKIYILGKKHLQLVKNRFKEVITDTSKGYLLPVDYAKKYLTIAEF